jgi:hypothetical protein
VATLIVPAGTAPSFVNGLANALQQLEEQIKAKQAERWLLKGASQGTTDRVLFHGKHGIH